MLKVTPRVTRLVNYIKEIEEGRLQIPLFQRDFIWGKKQKLELFGSLKLGYPIGSLLFWKPKETFKVKSEIGPFYTPKRSEGDTDYFYILDGFQRLSTLLGCLVNPQISLLEKIPGDIIKEFTVYYDLDSEEFTFSRSTPTDINLIPVNTLIDTFGFLEYVERLRSTLQDETRSTLLIDRARRLSSSILDYQLPSIEINGGTIEDAVDIFSRINSKGSSISSDWMVSALTYNEEKGFRLGTVIDDLLIRLRTFNFGKLRRDVILQCIQSSFGRIYFDEKLADLVKKPDFIKVTKNTIENIYKAVKFLFEDLLVLDSKLIPYNSQLIFITYFFNQINDPSAEQLRILKKWFWITSYSSYFTIYSLSKQRLAFNVFQDFVAGKVDNPVFNDKPNIPFAVTDFPQNIFFGSVRAKTLVLFLLNHSNDFKPASSVDIDDLKLIYLFKEKNKPAGVVPIINYLQDSNKHNYLHDKQEDFSFFFNDIRFETEGQKFFLSKNMKQLYFLGDYAAALELREDVIKHAEKGFTQSLGLSYDVG